MCNFVFLKLCRYRNQIDLEELSISAHPGFTPSLQSKNQTSCWCNILGIVWIAWNPWSKCPYLYTTKNSGFMQPKSIEKFSPYYDVKAFIVIYCDACLSRCATWHGCQPVTKSILIQQRMGSRVYFNHCLVEQGKSLFLASENRNCMIQQHTYSNQLI